MVFHRRHDPETLADRIDQLMVAVLMVDDRERLEQIAPHVADDFVYVSADAVVDGAQGLSDNFRPYRHDGSSTELRRTSDVEVHHGYFRFRWTRSAYGRTAMEGWAFGWLNDAGLLSRIVTFDGLTPGGVG